MSEYVQQRCRRCVLVIVLPRHLLTLSVIKRFCVYYLHVWSSSEALILRHVFPWRGVLFTASVLNRARHRLLSSVCHLFFSFLDAGKPKCFHTSGLKFAGALAFLWVVTHGLAVNVAPPFLCSDLLRLETYTFCLEVLSFKSGIWPEWQWHTFITVIPLPPQELVRRRSEKLRNGPPERMLPHLLEPQWCERGEKKKKKTCLMMTTKLWWRWWNPLVSRILSLPCRSQTWDLQKESDGDRFNPQPAAKRLLSQPSGVPWRKRAQRSPGFGSFLFLLALLPFNFSFSSAGVFRYHTPLSSSSVSTFCYLYPPEDV